MIDNTTYSTLVEEAKKYRSEQYQLFEDEIGWQDWMNDYTEATEDEVVTETELEEINTILRCAFNEAHNLLNYIERKAKEEGKTPEDYIFIPNGCE